MFRDFKELLSVLNAHRVKYLVVGGYAVSLHAEPRATKDLDVLIGPNAENGNAAFAALAEFGAPLGGLTAKDFTEPGSFFRMGAPPVMVDILSSIKGVDFDQAWERRFEFPVEPGLNVSFISRADLLAAKLAAGRPQDLADAAALGEHLDPVEQQSHEAEADSPPSDMEAAKKQAVADSVAYRAQHEAEHGSQSLEERRAKAAEDWKKLRKQKTRAVDLGKRSRAKGETLEEPVKGGGKDASEDPDL
jgi:Nucleotidyltransferase of unknown function (DUF6036)